MRKDSSSHVKKRAQKYITRFPHLMEKNDHKNIALEKKRPMKIIFLLIYKVASCRKKDRFLKMCLVVKIMIFQKKCEFCIKSIKSLENPKLLYLQSY